MGRELKAGSNDRAHRLHRRNCVSFSETELEEHMNSDPETQSPARRRLLRTLAGSGIAIGAAATLPQKWVRPVVDAVVVPLHAQTSPPIVNPLSLVGTWSGTWNDTIQGTSGTATMIVTVDGVAGTFSVSLDLNGPVLAKSDPPVQVFGGTFSAAGGVFDGVKRLVPRFGFVTGTVSPTGVLLANIAPLPESGSLAITGSVRSNQIQVAYTGSGGFPILLNFAGTLTLTK